MSKKPKQSKPIVKVPRSKVGRAVFAGTQAASAFAAVRSIRDARAKHDKLALLHGALNAAVLVVTALIAVRTMRAIDADKSDGSDMIEPTTLAAAER